ncbi:MAG: sulfatase-like hydrolase/transferase [bacterium]|nr:sulfatase-like hydrolase/transferase [bacterium]
MAHSTPDRATDNPTRREFLKSISLFLGAALLPSLTDGLPAAPAKGSEAPPNILFIMTDEQTWTAVGAAGNRDIRTPNLDRLAREGAWFDQCIVYPSGPRPIARRRAPRSSRAFRRTATAS